MVFVLIGISAPPVVLALVFVYVFGFELGRFPIADYCNFLPGSGPGCSGPLRWAYHMILPWATMTWLYAAAVILFVTLAVIVMNFPRGRRVLVDRPSHQLG